MSTPKKLKLAVVTSRFNSEITEKLEMGAIRAFEKLGKRAKIKIVRVPGAIEIPLAVQALLKNGIDGVAVCGAVIRGETSHYDYVCNSVERGCSQLMLEYQKPIGFGVLTTETEEQAYERAGGRHGNKGYESAQTVLEMIETLNQIKGEK